MKLLIAIVNSDDASAVTAVLSEDGFFVTRLASTGGYLMNENATLLMGVPDEDVEHAISLIGNNTKKRTKSAPDAPAPLNGLLGKHSAPAEVTVGGATVFVIDLEQYRRV